MARTRRGRSLLLIALISVPVALLAALALHGHRRGWFEAGSRAAPGSAGSGSLAKGSAATGPAVPVQFVDVAEEVGIRFQHVDGRSGQKHVLEIVGAGAAFFDYDQDGDPDLYLVNGAGTPGYTGPPGATDQLFDNAGGRFTDVTDKAGVRESAYGHGCAAGDADGDGDIDLYVTNYGPNALLRNNGDRTFTDVAAASGVTDPQWSTSCAFADYDRDGDLDLYVVNYIEFRPETSPWCGLKEKGVRAYCEPNNFPGQPDTLFRNEGDGKFADVTRASGVYHPGGKGLGVAWGDYDNDGDPDIYVANDSTENNLYQNRGDGKFEDLAFMLGVAVNKDGAVMNGMGTTFGDWNNDGWLDLTVTNYVDQSNTLYRNDGDGFFTDITTSSTTGPITYPYVGWATEMFDYDSDGFLDLFVANGHLHDNLAELGQPGKHGQRNLLFANRRDGTFDEISARLGAAMQLEESSRGAAFADYDQDGDVDILVTNVNGPPRLLRNDGSHRNHWLAVKLVSANGRGDAIGARVTARIGSSLQIRDVRSGSGYLSQHELKVIFGLGQHAVVERLEVLWPSGKRQSLDNVPANQTVTVSEVKT